MIGESPTLPGTFHDSPLVVVTDEISPFALTAFMLMVPVVNFTCRGSSNVRLAVAGGRTLSLRLSSQLSAGFRQAFQRSQARLLFSVGRLCSLNPISRADLLASGPTGMVFSGVFMACLAPGEGVGVSLCVP